MRQLNIYIVAAFPVIIEGIKNFLNSKDFINVTGHSHGIEQILLELNHQTEQQPDILILDDSGFDKPGYISLLNSIPNIFPLVKIIIFTGSNEPVYLKQLVDMGVNGILHKSASGEHGENFIDALKLIGIGNVYFDNQITTSILKEETIKEITNHHLKLFSGREKEILLLIAEGKKNREISEMLFISTGTVDVHKAHLIKKLNLKSTTELAVFAVSNKDNLKLLVHNN